MTHICQCVYACWRSARNLPFSVPRSAGSTHFRFVIVSSACARRMCGDGYSSIHPSPRRGYYLIDNHHHARNVVGECVCHGMTHRCAGRGLDIHRQTPLQCGILIHSHEPRELLVMASISADKPTAEYVFSYSNESIRRTLSTRAVCDIENVCDLMTVVCVFCNF